MIRRYVAFLFLALGFAVPALGAPSDQPVRVGFAAALSGPLEARSRVYLEGVRAALERWSGTWRILDRPVELILIDTNGERATAKLLEKDVRKKKLHLLVGAPSGRDLDLVTGLARRVRVPLVLASVWEPRFSVGSGDQVFFFGGNTVDHALGAAGYTEIPQKAARAAALHDGSPASKRLAEAYLRNLHPRTRASGARRIPETVKGAEALLALLAEARVDLVFVCGEVDACRSLSGVEGDRPPFLFADGLLVPELTASAREGDRFLVGVNPYLVDGEPDRLRITREEEGLPPLPLAARGYAAVTLGLRAFREVKGDPRKVTSALHAFGYEKMMGTSMFAEWGQARFFRYELWEVKEGVPLRIKPTYLPTQGVGLLLRHVPSSRFTLDPGGMMVLVTWGGERESTIDEDLSSIGLSSRGYEGNIDEMVKDGILARAMARLNRLFWRNADGTPIPGISFNITFGTSLPKNVKRQQWWEMRIRGDDPVAGGRASGSLALVFSTFIERTMYRGLRLDPALGRTELDFFTGRYEWGSLLERNIRNDEIRALMEGFSGALAMTGAHEIGHLAGLSHDTTSDRSIMNVEEGGGLEPDWAEWVPDHVRLLETRLKRHDPGRRRGRR